ncbi:MAG: magnesium transporter [Eubacteriaceae bacterium]|nr:magnesium transporter [Eubacteriaceae bacterium]
MANQIATLLNEAERFVLRKELDQMNHVDIAEELEELGESDTLKVFRMLSKDKAADTFAYLDSTIQQSIIEAITDREIGSIIDELFLDDAVDFIEEMPANVVRRVLANVAPDKRDMINSFLKYPEDSTGSIMTIEFVDLKDEMTVAEAFARIRSVGPNKETVYTCYVIDNARKLIGFVSARTLFLSNHDSFIKDIMEPNVIFARTSDDKEDLMNSFRKYGYLAMPVVDSEDRLVGMVTFDDALTVQEEEDTEDFEKMAALKPSQNTYLKTTVFELSKNRIFWLLLLNLSVFLTGSIVAMHEGMLAVMPSLVAFMPLLMDTSGDAGSQSSTLVIRGLALEEIKLSDILKVFFIELRVALICGGVLAVVNCFRIMAFGNSFPLALTVSLSLYVTIILSKTAGAILPIVGKMVNLDPAVMAGPALTTIVDAVSILIYFSIAKAILGL